METLSPVADPGPITVENFERLLDEASRMELVRGHVIREPPAGFEHGAIAAQIAFLIQAFVRGHALGKVVGAETGFVLFDDPPTVRAPDVAFVARERLPIDRRSFARLAPDLAVEIVSPSNTISGIQDKVSDYLDAGTRLDPQELDTLIIACRDHSVGLMEGDPTVLACWDADRLDLGRVGIRPRAELLCTAIAREPGVMEWAYRRSVG